MIAKLHTAGRAGAASRLRPHALYALLLLTLLTGCATTGRELPPKDLAESPDCSAGTAVGELADRIAGTQPGHSGILLLDTGAEAFRARAALIEAATCSIDAQYYIWNSDASGRYLASRLLAAADRGVRVRLLLDDINVGDREGVIGGAGRASPISKCRSTTRSPSDVVCASCSVSFRISHG